MFEAAYHSATHLKTTRDEFDADSEDDVEIDWIHTLNDRWIRLGLGWQPWYALVRLGTGTGTGTGTGLGWQPWYVALILEWQISKKMQIPGGSRSKQGR